MTSVASGQGQRRNIKDPAAWHSVDVDLVKNVADEILALRIAYFTRMVPTYVDWIVELLGPLATGGALTFLNDYLFPKYRQDERHVVLSEQSQISG
eukprot:Skav230134  [mRNA]  locus=scaffold1301:53753:55029:+ [translate_table: standard]